MEHKQKERFINYNPIIDNKNCYVAFLDILGFSNMVLNNSPEIIKELFYDLMDRESMLKEVKTETFGNKNRIVELLNKAREELFVYNMSDSLVLAINTSNEINLDFLLYISDYIQWYLFEKANILIRGGVSIGSFYGEGIMSFGKGFIYAHELESKKAKYPRIIIDRKLEDILEDWNTDVTDDAINYPNICSSLYFAYSAVKENENDYYYIDWINNSNKSKLNELCKRELKSLEAKDDGNSERIKEKYNWIVDRIKRRNK